ncbi:MAG: CbtB domain-containing protein [Methylococcales bacterium]
MFDISHKHSYPITRTRNLAAYGAAVLGLIILFAVGFAPVPAMHNAAHDTRHSFAFPCH